MRWGSRGDQRGVESKQARQWEETENRRIKTPRRKVWAEREWGWMDAKRVEKNKPTGKRGKCKGIRFVLRLKKIIKEEILGPSKMQTQRGF